MSGKVLKMNNMRKINNSVIMNKSAGNPATTYTHNRCAQCKKDTKEEIIKCNFLSFQKSFIKVSLQYE